ncbi:uncharacterized protein [Triticum aestivum]|uniref:uncharacterized protein n=1 Tax=Triticum aestivum TaxID=4565 RepID=UPI001D01F81D|nr:uncharacterized protein LOC123039232 [Triticum aestivum]
MGDIFFAAWGAAGEILKPGDEKASTRCPHALIHSSPHAFASPSASLACCSPLPPSALLLLAAPDSSVAPSPSPETSPSPLCFLLSQFPTHLRAPSLPSALQNHGFDLAVAKLGVGGTQPRASHSSSSRALPRHKDDADADAQDQDRLLCWERTSGLSPGDNVMPALHPRRGEAPHQRRQRGALGSDSSPECSSSGSVLGVGFRPLRPQAHGFPGAQDLPAQDTRTCSRPPPPRPELGMEARARERGGQQRDGGEEAWRRARRSAASCGERERRSILFCMQVMG